MPSRRSSSANAPLPPLALTFDQLARPSADEETRLLRAAERIWALVPWKTWSEDQIFVVRSPETQELGFVSVIGGSKQQFGIIVYRGAGAYFGLLDFIERISMSQMPPWLNDLAASGLNADTMPPDLAAFVKQMSDTMVDPTELLQIPQLQLNFDARKDLDPLDKEWLERNGYNAKGRGFPTFRSFVPGYLPWWISSEDARFLAVALEQFLEVAGRKWFNWDSLEVKESGNRKPVHELFARLPKVAKNGDITWSDGRLKVSPDEGGAYAVELDPDEELLERIEALPQGQTPLEMELVSFPAPLGGEQERPCFPSLLVAGSGGMVVGSETILCGSPSPYLLAPLLNAILKVLAAQRERPAALHFASPEMALLQAVGEMTDIPVRLLDQLETLDPAIEALMEAMESGQLFEDSDENDVPRLH